MSIDFIVVCKRPLPPDWSLDFRPDGLPFDFWLEDFSSWSKDTREWLAETEERDAFMSELERRLAEGGSFVAGFNCRPIVVELVDRCAEDLTARFGGYYYDDHGTELSDISAGVAGATGSKVLRAWQRLVADWEAEQARGDEQERSDLVERHRATARPPTARSAWRTWTIRALLALAAVLAYAVWHGLKTQDSNQRRRGIGRTFAAWAPSAGSPCHRASCRC